MKQQIWQQYHNESWGQTRSSLIHFAGIGVAPPRLFEPQREVTPMQAKWIKLDLRPDNPMIAPTHLHTAPSDCHLKNMGYTSSICHKEDNSKLKQTAKWDEYLYCSARVSEIRRDLYASISVYCQSGCLQFVLDADCQFNNRSVSKLQTPFTTQTEQNFSRGTLPWLGSGISLGVGSQLAPEIYSNESHVLGCVQPRSP